jgi:uncharacterized repeat protein (TIGR03803 family)
MERKQRFFPFSLILLLILMSVGECAVAQSEKILYDFANAGSAGAFTIGKVIFDAAGNLYGTTDSGGAYGYGTVFELTPATSGNWKLTTLYSFKSGTDGQNPRGGLIFDASGNLYGTTRYGGTEICNNTGCGTVFEISPNGTSGWTEKILHNFNTVATDGYLPGASLVMDVAGNLYGTTVYGGQYQGPYTGGTVFELLPSGGKWTERVLHSFGYGTDGDFPQGALIFDKAGNLYGTTVLGGTNELGDGIVFELTKSKNIWQEKILFNFTTDTTGYSGISPTAALVFDSAGNLYGSTEFGGKYLWGNVFKLSPATGGGWTETVLHSFSKSGSSGYEPQADLILDCAGNLYSTAFAGGTGGYGTVFELKPNAAGIWPETVLHSFQDNGTDGNNPDFGLIFDTKGNLYGMTPYGGTGVYGTVFKITR